MDGLGSFVSFSFSKNLLSEAVSFKGHDSRTSWAYCSSSPSIGLQATERLATVDHGLRISSKRNTMAQTPECSAYLPS